MVQLIFHGFTPIRKVVLENNGYLEWELQKKAKEYLKKVFKSENFDFYLLHNGKLLYEKKITQGEVHVIPRLNGGKGGFGSMLRAIGAQIEKTTNREACRDLSGRRLRDINEEKRLKKWITEQAEREQEALRRKRKKLEKLNQEVKHEFTDEEYIKARIEMPEKIHEAVEQGFKATVEEPSSSQDKKEIEVKNIPKKKKTKGKLWVDDLLDDSDDSESNSDNGSPSCKKIKLS